MSYSLGDDAFYADRPVPHTAQGDLYANVQLTRPVLAGDAPKPSGSRKRSLFRRGHEPDPYVPELVVVANYTCGFVAQPPGTPGYSHDHRLVAPVVPLTQLRRAGITANDLRKVANGSQLSGILRLPPPPGWQPHDGWAGDEFDGHVAACLWHLSPVSQTALDGAERVARLSLPAQRMLIMGLIQVVSPYLFDADDPDLQDPDLSNSWGPQASPREQGPSGA